MKFNNYSKFEKAECEAFHNKAKEIKYNVHNKIGDGNEFTGWVNLPSSINKEFIDDIELTAKNFAKNIDFAVVIGIGGSYLGAKAVIDALNNSFSNFIKNDVPKILYAGFNISEDYLFELTEFLKDKKFGIIVISKSGTTLEPALAFRLLKNLLEKNIGVENASKKIIAITDKSRGALKTLATKNNYKTYEIPDNVGGRYSVLTPVGLLPICIAGFDIKKIIDGAIEMEKTSAENIAIEHDIAMQYAISRNILYKQGKKIEILVNYNPKLHFFGEWWKQLFGESEGKDGKGIFPAIADFSTDLHSMGQYIQDGERHIFETVLSIEKPFNSLTVPKAEENLDNLNFLAEKNVEFINKQAQEGTRLAHEMGKVPNFNIEIEKLDEINIGKLIYFFEKACAYSAYFIDVNPFNQPGVEAYKQKMFQLLEK